MSKASTVAVTDAAAILVVAASVHAVQGMTMVTSGAGPTELLSGHADRYQVAVGNPSGSTAYLGSSAVTDTTGYPLAAGDRATLDLVVGEAIYARCATGGTATLRVLVLA